MNDSGQGGPFVMKGKPPQLTDSVKCSFDAGLQAESPFFAFMHSFAPFLHPPFGLLTSVAQAVQPQCFYGQVPGALKNL